MENKKRSKNVASVDDPAGLDDRTFSFLFRVSGLSFLFVSQSQEIQAAPCEKKRTPAGLKKAFITHSLNRLSIYWSGVQPVEMMSDRI